MDSLELLRTLVERKKQTNEQIKTMVVLLHESGYSYESIGDVLGVSRQRAQHIGSHNGATQRIRNYTKERAGE